MEEIGPGTRIANLRVERELGRGAFSRVYLARDDLIGRPVALKVVANLGGDQEEERERILAEARTVGRLHSPHIVTLYRVHPGGPGEAWIFEFEYVEGGTLDALLVREGPLGADRARPIALGIARALRTAHARSILHGDVKPGNVLLGEGDVPKLADFGLARVLGDLGLRLSTRDDLAGTPVYMAPEVLMGEAAGPWSDVWSFGVLCYRMLSGRMPFGSPHLHGLVYAIQNREADPLPAAVPPELARLVQHCLVKQPDLRPADGAALEALLEGRRRVPTPPPAPAKLPAHRGRLYGRAAEQQRLRACLQAAEDERRGGVVLLSGEAGIGKSALARAFGALVRQRAVVWVEAQVTALQGLLGPLLRGLEESLRAAPPGVLAQETQASLEALIADPVSASGTVKGTLPGVRSVLAQVLGRCPVVLFAEDLQEAREEDVAVLTDLAERLAPRGLLILAAARTVGGDPRLSLPPHLHGFASLPMVEPMPLDRLPAEELFAMLEDQLHGLRLDPEIARRIHEQTAGNPLFACDLLRHMEESHCVVRDDVAVQRGPAWHEATLPRRFHDLVAARLVHLSDEDRGLLDVAAVAGTRFDGTDVAAVTDVPLLTVLRRLQDLCRRRGLVEPRERGYRFASPLIQEVIYRELAPDLRRLLHRSLAERLERDDGGDDPERTAAHWEGAQVPERARPHLIRAARRAFLRQEGARATRLAERAGLVLDRLGPDDVREHADLILSLTSFDVNRERAPAVLEAVRSAAVAMGDEDLARRALVRLADVDYKREGARGIDPILLEDADANLPDCFERVRASILLSLVTKFRGELAAADAHLGRAEHHASAIGHLGLQSTVRDLQGSLALRSGRLDAAEQLYRRASQLSDRAGRRINAAVSRVNAIIAAFSRGVLDGSLDELESAIRTLDLEGAAAGAAHARLVLSDLCYACGETQAARAHVEMALKTLEGERRVVAYEMALLQQGNLAFVTGQLDAALASLEQAQELAERRGTLFVRSEALAWRVRCLCRLGRYEDAHERAGECVAATLDLDDALARGSTGLLLAESLVDGLEIARVGLSSLLAKAGEGPYASLGRALLDAAGPWHGPEAPGDALRAAAEAMRAEAPGIRRAERGVVAHLLDAEASARDGDRATAARHAEAGHGGARRIGHVWLELDFLRRADDGEGKARFRARLEEVAAASGGADTADAVRRARTAAPRN